jgi:glycosyltransferase involved in cell wall biosynthesis
MTSVHKRYDVRILEKQCVSLVNNGYEVILIVNDDQEDEIYKEVQIISTGFNFKNRIDRILNAKKHILKKALEVNAEIYQFHDPDLLFVGNELKKKGKKVIFDSHEDVPKQILSKVWIPKAIRYFISWSYKLYEKKSVKGYDAVISVTPNIIKRFLKNNPKTFMITNYPILSSKDLTIYSSNKQYKNNEYICFAGGISSQWNHDKIISALKNINNVKYLLAGSGDQLYLDKLKGLTGWEKVDYRGKIPHHEVKSLYAKSIVGMAINYSYQSKKEGTLGNTKLFEYMEAGLPIICSNHKLWVDIIEEYKCGIYVNPNSVEDIEKAVRWILKNPEEAKKMGINGRQAVLDKYNWKEQEKILLQLYKNI